MIELNNWTAPKFDELNDWASPKFDELKDWVAPKFDELNKLLMDESIDEERKVQIFDCKKLIHEERDGFSIFHI